jgi:hypothetical protein
MCEEGGGVVSGVSEFVCVVAWAKPTKGWTQRAWCRV